MRKDDSVYLGHMLDMAHKALALAGGKTREDYDGDEALRLGLTHLLQVIGEAARHVSVELKGANPRIPWKDIVGMRHKVVHEYMRVDEDVVWETVTQELDPLIAEIERILPAEGERP